MRQFKLWGRLMFIAVCGVAIWQLFIQVQPSKAQGETKNVQPEQREHRRLRAAILFKDWYYPKAELKGTSTCSGPSIASITQQTFIAMSPIKDVWDFYAGKVSPPNARAPKWSPGSYSGETNSGRTDEYQYMMYQHSISPSQMGSFVVHKKGITIHVHISSAMPDKSTLIVLTADEPLPIQETH